MSFSGDLGTGALSSGSSAISRVGSSAWFPGWLSMFSGSCIESGLDGLGGW